MHGSLPAEFTIQFQRHSVRLRGRVSDGHREFAGLKILKILPRGIAEACQTTDQLRQFQYNKLMPFQRKDRLSQMKLAAANARFDAGMQNIFGGLGGMSLLKGKKDENG